MGMAHSGLQSCFSGRLLVGVDKQLEGSHNRPMSGLLDLLLPAVCPLCMTADGPGLCPGCVAALPELDRPCRWCGMPLALAQGRVGPCANCDERGFPHLSRTVVRWAYAGGIERLVGNAKAAGRPAAVRACTTLLPSLPTELAEEGPLLVVPIPPSPGRRQGPHLGTALAKAVARACGQPWAPWLSATRLAREQHRLNVAQRQENVVGLFSCRPRPGPPPRLVVLVDDLLTSGATATAAAGTLRAAGVGEVVLLVLARTL